MVKRQETEIALIQQSLNTLTEKIDLMSNKLFGNGKPGKLDEQDKRITDIEKKIIAYGVGITILIFIITLFGPRIVAAIIGS